MKLISAVCVAGLVLTSNVFANSVPDLLKSKNCLACHAVDKKVVGPAYKDVAAKYKGNKDAVNILATKIQKGGSGVWGAVPMPPSAVTAAEAKQLATWVMSQK